MAKSVSKNDIQNMSEDWGLDPSNGLPYSGAAVQKFIKKTFGSKMGYFHYDTSSNRYLVFADEESKDKYMENPTMTELVLGTFDAPFNYEASITMLTPSYNAVFLGSTGNYLDFTFDIKNKQGNSTGENVTVTYTFIRNATKQVVTETRRYGESVHFNIDEYILEGTNTIIVGVSGQTTLAATTAALTYQVVNLSYSDEMNIARVYDLSQGAYAMEVFFNVSGYGTKIVEWFLDGNQLEFVKSEDEVVDVTAQRTKYIELSNLTSGIHTIQSRAYTLINGEKFYTDTLYREFMVNNGDSTNNIVAVAANIPHSHGIVNGSNPFVIYGVEQYIPYVVRFATRKTGNVSVYLASELLSVVNSVAGTESSYTITSNKSGTLVLKFVVDNIIREIPVSVNQTSLNIEEIKTALSFDFRASGRSNLSVDKDSWSYEGYTGTFRGFNWNASSGWVDNALLINNGASFSVNIAPLVKDATSTGKTLEFEFSTRNVENDDAVICDLTTGGKGLLITASEARLTSAAGEVVSTRFKAGEVNRIAFVINRKTGVTYKGLAFIYVNGILSGAVNYGSADNFLSSKELVFVGTDNAQVELRAMRFYDTALSAENIINNYILYRDTLNEMMEVYYRNDIYEEGTQTFSPDAMLHRLPVMVITGDVPTLEGATSTSTQILVDIDFTNEQDPTKNFRMTNAALRIQGTSSLAYPRKNFRFYTQKEASTMVYDANGKVIQNKLYSFKDGAQPVDCWCLKADFAESSGTHNTGIARLWNKAMYGAIIQHKNVLGVETNGYALRTNAQVAALSAGYPYDVRTTIDGFPIVLFYKKNASDTDLIFLGKYNFNNDKSTPSVFGFENIPGFNNARMQCWETKDNGHPLGLFTDVSRFDADWSEAFESRYPDTKNPYTTDLKNFSIWINGVSQSNFVTQKWAHFDVYKVAAYYCYLMRFGAVDQPVKNAFLTSEDGEKFYFINYDNDTINGLINTGRLVLDPTVNRDTIGSDGEYVYAGHNSVLWNKLTNDAEFMEIVSIVDNALYSAGLRYDEVIAEFNEGQADKWVERVYNQDAEYKYLLPYVNQATNNLFMLQGSRSSHRSWWLSKRFSLYDSLFLSGAYRDRNISFKCLNDTQPGQKFSITAATSMNYGYGVNNGIRETGVELAKEQVHTFTTTDTLNLGDVVKVFAAANILEFNLSQMANRIAVLDCSAAADPSLGTKMKKLILGGAGKVNTELAAISGINVLASLQELNVEGYQNMTTLNLTAQKDLRKVFAKGSSVASIDFAAGAPVEHLELPSAMMALNLNQLPYITSDSLVIEGGLDNIGSISVSQCPKLSNDFDFSFNWLTSELNVGKSFTMDSLDWKYVTPNKLIQLGEVVKNNPLIKLSGVVELLTISLDEANLIKEYFGDDVFDKNANFRIKAPESIFLSIPQFVLEGDSVQVSAIVFSENMGSVEYSILLGSREGVTLDPYTGYFSTIENGLEDVQFTIRAVHTSTDGKISFVDGQINVVKRTYPTSLSINGLSSSLLETNEYTQSVSPSDYTGEPKFLWELEGDAVDEGLLTLEKQSQTDCTIRLNGRLDVQKTAVLSCSMFKKDGTTLIKIATKTLTVEAYTYPSSVTISGSKSVKEGSKYGLSYDKIEFTGSINEVSWFLTGDITEFVEIEEYTNIDCSLRLLKEVTVTVSGTLSVMVYLGNGSVLESTLNVLALDPTVLISSATNPKVIEILYSKGLCSSPDFMTYDEAAEVTDSQMGSGSSAIFRLCLMESFEEFEFFTGLTKLPSYSFAECKNLKVIKLPPNIKTIEANAFSSGYGSVSKLESLYLNENLEEVRLFNNQYLQSLNSLHITNLESFAKISFYDSADKIGETSTYNVGFFSSARTDSVIYLNGSPLTEITIGISTTEVGQGFACCKTLKKVSFTDNVTKIKGGAFLNCSSLEEINLPSSNCEIFYGAFGESSIREVDFKNNIIKGACLTDCNSLTKVKIGSSCDVRSNPIFNCSNVKTLEGEGFVDNKYYLKNGVLSFVNKSLINVDSFEIPEGVTEITEYCFCTMTLGRVSIPESVKTIGIKAFYSTKVSGNEFTIPESVTHIGFSAFSGLSVTGTDPILNFKCSLTGRGDMHYPLFATNCKKLKIYSTVTSFKAYCFRRAGFEEVEFEEGFNMELNNNSSDAFYDCEKIRKFNIPVSCTCWLPRLFRHSKQEWEIHIANLESFCKIPTSQSADGPNNANVMYVNGSILKDLTIPESVDKLSYAKFSTNKNLESVVFHENFKTLSDRVFQNCKKLKNIIFYPLTPPSIMSATFLYAGTEVESEKMFYVPISSEELYSGIGWDVLIGNGFEKKSLITVTECVSLTITADNVSGRNVTTTIYWNAIVNGVNPINGSPIEGVELSGTSISEAFSQNISETETKEVTISFTYYGVTATTTITQGVWVNAIYTLNLNNQWEQSSSVSNPDTSIYDGVYQSFSNKGQDNTAAICTINIVGYETFSLYIRSYAEGNYDYVMVSQLDVTINNNSSYSDLSLVKAHTRGKQVSGTSISDYTLVEFTGIDQEEHTITIVYRKDSSTSTSDDRGYLLIPKNQ